MLLLDTSEVVGELQLFLVIDGPEKMVYKDIFGRNSRIGFKLERPMTILGLLVAEPLFCFFNDPVDLACIGRL